VAVEAGKSDGGEKGLRSGLESRVHGRPSTPRVRKGVQSSISYSPAPRLEGFLKEQGRDGEGEREPPTPRLGRDGLGAFEEGAEETPGARARKAQTLTEKCVY
jgi:hypothetical protein